MKNPKTFLYILDNAPVYLFSLSFKTSDVVYASPMVVYSSILTLNKVWLKCHEYATGSMHYIVAPVIFNYSNLKAGKMKYISILPELKMKKQDMQ